MMENSTLQQDKLICRRIWANRIIFIGKCFILLAILFLAYLLWTVRKGYRSTPEEKLMIAQRVIPFELIPEYSITFASDGLFSKIVVLDNSSTSQRIVLNRLYFRKERKPEGFIAKFNHPHRQIKLRKSTFTGLENPTILDFGTLKESGIEIPFVIVESQTARGLRKGAIYCLYCSSNGKSYFVEGSAPVNSFSEKDMQEFVQRMIPCRNQK